MRVTPSLISKNIPSFSSLWLHEGAIGSPKGKAAQGERPLDPPNGSTEP
jgi:hypothetical protein